MVDDNAGVRETIATLLMSAGYDVVVAEDGFAAHLSAEKEPVPRMSGFEFLSVLRRRFPFCPGTNKYIIQPSGHDAHKACA